MTTLNLKKLSFDSALDRIKYLETTKRAADIGLTAFAADIIITATITTKRGLDSVITIEDTAPDANTVSVYSFNYANTDNHAVNAFIMSVATMLEFDGSFGALADVTYDDMEDICEQLKTRYIP